MTQLPQDEEATHPGYVLEDDQPLVGKEVLQFGNKKNPSGLYADWYKAKGLNIAAQCMVSVDWNGKDGALNLDCNTPIFPGLHHDGWCGFDLVTNFGFSEHVTNQPMMWRNQHDCCKVGGHMIGVTPAPGHWPHHGILQPTREFYRLLAKYNTYHIEALWVNEDRKRHTVCYTFRKMLDEPFVMPAHWEQWIIPTEAPSKAALQHSRVK